MTRLEHLFEKYFDKTASADERAELASLINEPGNKEEVMRLFGSSWEKYQGDGEIVPAHKTEQILEHILGETKLAPVHRMNTGNFKWWRQIAAAVIVLLLSIGGYFYFNKNEKQIAITQPVKDVGAPKNTKATITLANGQKVLLDSIANGTLATQNNVTLSKINGQIIYNGTANEVVYNTLTNPRGSNVVDITLADGSHVWLNAASSLTYPVAFLGKERKVQITGEAYFEVAHYAAMPFIVQKNNVNVQVLGTHFNVNTYDDESEIKITLLEGSVKVENGKLSSILTPGQQANVTSEIKVKNDADIEEVMAWKNGKFDFLNGTNITAIMRQVSRWYDVEVKYQGNVSKLNFSGKMSRKENASRLLEILKATGTVDFKIEDNKIIVISK